MVGWWDFRNLLRFGEGELEERLILGSRPTISDGDKGFVKTLFYTCEVVCTLLPFVPSAFVCILRIAGEWREVLYVWLEGPLLIRSLPLVLSAGGATFQGRTQHRIGFSVKGEIRD